MPHIKHKEFWDNPKPVQATIKSSCKRLQIVPNRIANYHKLKHTIMKKDICILILILTNIVGVILCDILLTRLETARNYVNDLESIIECDGTVVGDVCGSDAYVDYYNTNTLIK